MRSAFLGSSHGGHLLPYLEDEGDGLVSRELKAALSIRGRQVNWLAFFRMIF